MVYNIVKKNENIVLYAVSALGIVFAYSYLFLIAPLSSDTVGAYFIGNGANLNPAWSVANGRWGRAAFEVLLQFIGYNNIIPIICLILSIIICPIFCVKLVRIFQFKSIIVSIFVCVTIFLTPAFVELFSFFEDFYTHIFISTLLMTILLDFYLVKKNTVISIIIFSIIIGIYQSYFCFVTSIILMFYLKKLISDSNYSVDNKDIVRFIVFNICSLALYFITSLLAMKFFNINSVLSQRFLNSDTSVVSLAFKHIIKIYGMIAILPFKNYAGLNTTPLMKFVFTFIYVFILYRIIHIIKNGKFKRNIHLILLLFVLPVFMNSIALLGTNITIRMTQGLGLVYLLFSVFVDEYITSYNTKNYFCIISLIYGLIAFNMMYFANGYSYHLGIASEATKSFCVELVSNIRNTVGYNSNSKVYFHGSVSYKNLFDYYAYIDDKSFPLPTPNNSLIFPWEYRETFERYAAFKYEMPTETEIQKLVSAEEFANMNVYPNYGSIKYIDNVIVVKFNE